MQTDLQRSCMVLTTQLDLYCGKAHGKPVMQKVNLVVNPGEQWHIEECEAGTQDSQQGAPGPTPSYT